MPSSPKVAWVLGISSLALAVAVGFRWGQSQTGHPLREKQPSAAVAYAPATISLPDQCAQTAELWRKQLGQDCQALVRSPFVLVGNLADDQLAQLYERTIAPAAAALAHDYFATAPHQPITLLCFADGRSYAAAAGKLLGERQPSPYGFYRPHGRVVVANIATGTGTLVHELTHALIDFDFPTLADWFNEGLASLHEACRYATDDGGQVHLLGLPNWRLPGLQKRIVARSLRPTANMIAANDFRGKHEGVNYAHARYLCLYLQTQGQLGEFYRKYRANRDTDPQGLKSLTEVLQIEDWAKFDRVFGEWVLNLKLE